MFRDFEGLPRLIGSLDANARAIDVTFATAGQQLGDGLGLFQALNEKLGALSGELAGSEIEQARASLHRLGGELRTLNDDLAAETAALENLSIHSLGAAQAFERLLEHMRLITILARSARIEAISIPKVGSDFGDFAGEIGTLTVQAQRTIERCARDQTRLCSLLDSALAAQREFEGRYGKSLAALADKLGLTLAEVARRQGRSVALTADAAAISGRITLATGGAIIALQSGDSLRQRLEHAIAALRLGEVAGPLGEPTDEATRAACADVLLRLQSAQLEASAGALGPDVEEINGALVLLDGETTQLIDLVRSLYRGGNAKAASFLAELEADLAEASELLGRCDAARAGADRVTKAVAAILDSCEDTVETLATTASNIVLIGMNAGLRAARLGTGGRSLVVIAQELKFAADQVATDSRKLTPAFTQMQATSGELRREGRLDAAYFNALDRVMRGSLETMRQSGDRLGATLDELIREGGRFGSIIAQATLSFSSTGAMGDLIVGAANELARAAGTDLPEAHQHEAVCDFLQKEIWPNYTMAAERQVHASVLAACGLATAEAAPEPAVEDEVDEFLF